MKKLLLVIFVTLFITGCSVVEINNQSIDEIVDIILKDKSNLSNTTFQGYELYIPKDIMLIEKNENNNILVSNNNRYFLYVDVIAYYHKTEFEYIEKDTVYYSKYLNYNDKKGYLEINKVEDKYFVEVMFNYSKIEAYVSLEDIKEVVTESLIVLNNIKYKDIILSTLIGDNILNYNEEVINIFEPKGESPDILDYMEEYGQYEDLEKELPDEDNIVLDE